MQHLQEALRHLEHSYVQTKRPMKVNTECLHYREGRVGIDQVKDMVEDNLKKEVNNIRKYQDKMKILLEKVHRQVDDHKEVQARLRKDLEHKEMALDIDQTCFATHNGSQDIQHQAGIERVEATGSVPVSWEEFSAKNKRESKGEV